MKIPSPRRAALASLAASALAAASLTGLGFSAESASLLADDGHVISLRILRSLLHADRAWLPEGASAAFSKGVRFLARPRLIVIDSDRAGQAHLAIGQPLGIEREHPDYWPLRVLAAHLGSSGPAGSAGSGRLPAEIVERRHLGHGLLVSIDPPQGSVSPAQDPPPSDLDLTIALDVSPANAKFAIEAIVREIRDLAASGISPDQVAAAKSRLLPEPKGAASLDAVTPDDVSRALKAHLHPERIGIVAVVPYASAFVDEMMSRETKIEYPADVDRDSLRSRDLEIVGTDLGLSREDFDVVRGKAESKAGTGAPGKE